MNYTSKLKDPRWQKKRLQILDRDNFTCQYCTDTETELHIHHTKYTSQNPWEAKLEDLITLCKHCHAVSEYYKNTANYDFDSAPFNKVFKAILVPSVYCISVTKKGYFSVDLFYYFEKDNELKYMTWITNIYITDMCEFLSIKNEV